MYYVILIINNKTGVTKKQHMYFETKAEALRYCRLKSNQEVVYQCQ